MFIPESPRYLYSMKRWKELHTSLSFIAKVNGKNSEFQKTNAEPDVDKPIQFTKSERIETKSQESQDFDEISQSNGKEVEEFSIMTALKEKRTLVNLITIICLFSFVSFSYYMIAFYLKYIGGNIFINTIASSISDTIGNVLASVVQKKLGTKRSLTM